MPDGRPPTPRRPVGLHLQPDVDPGCHGADAIISYTQAITASNQPAHCGRALTQQLTITIGTGSSDRPAEISAGWSIHTDTLSIEGRDANISALWSVAVTSTGKVIFSNLPSRTTFPIDGFLLVQDHTGSPCGVSSCQLTVTNNLGSSITVTMPSPM